MKRLFATGLFVGALVLPLLGTAQATAGSDLASKARNAGVFVPDNIYVHQPFTFATTQVAEGEVVSIQTQSGEVVQNSSVDKFRRVFLPAGLAEGMYLIERSSDRQPLGKIEIKQRAGDALQRPWEHPPQPMQLTGSPQFAKISDSPSLTGHGFNPNAAQMEASVSASGQTHTVPVLAATEDQLKLAPVTQLSPGIVQLRITNNATGESTGPRQILLYDADGQLRRRKLTSGEQTAFEVHTRPENVPMEVRATISGQATFSDRSEVEPTHHGLAQCSSIQGREKTGCSEAEAITDHGLAVFPVQADRGAGLFQVSWEVTPLAAEEQSGEAVATSFHAQEGPPVGKGGIGGKLVEKVLEELLKKGVDEAWEYGKGGLASPPTQTQDGARHSCSTGPVDSTVDGYGEAKEKFWKRSQKNEDGYGGQLQEQARQNAHADLTAKVGIFLGKLKCDPPCKCYALVTYGDYYWEGHAWWKGPVEDTLTYWSRQSATVRWGCKE